MTGGLVQIPGWSGVTGRGMHVVVSITRLSKEAIAISTLCEPKPQVMGSGAVGMPDRRGRWCTRCGDVVDMLKAGNAGGAA